jgi:hypothetical protein
VNVLKILLAITVTAAGIIVPAALPAADASGTAIFVNRDRSLGAGLAYFCKDSQFAK